MTPNQCRQARELLIWTESDLAARAGVKMGTVMYFEGGQGKSMRTTVAALRAALEAGGVEIPNDGMLGPRLSGKMS